MVIAADTDTFTLILYMFCKINPAEKWYMKVDKSRYIDTSKVCNSYSKEILMMPSYHTILDATQHLIAIQESLANANGSARQR